MSPVQDVLLLYLDLSLNLQCIMFLPRLFDTDSPKYAMVRYKEHEHQSLLQQSDGVAQLHKLPRAPKTTSNLDWVLS